MKSCCKLTHMKRWSAIFLALSVCLAVADQKKRKKDKLPDLEVLEASARRIEGTIRIDGRVKNAGDTPIQGAILAFEFMDSGHSLLSIQKAPLDEDSLEPGKEAAFHVQLNDEVRAVGFQINAADVAERELRVVKPGPFAIE